MTVRQVYCRLEHDLRPYLEVHYDLQGGDTRAELAEPLERLRELGVLRDYCLRSVAPVPPSRGPGTQGTLPLEGA